MWQLQNIIGNIPKLCGACCVYGCTDADWQFSCQGRLLSLWLVKPRSSAPHCSLVREAGGDITDEVPHGKPMGVKFGDLGGHEVCTVSFLATLVTRPTRRQAANTL